MDIASNLPPACCGTFNLALTTAGVEDFYLAPVPSITFKEYLEYFCSFL